MPRVDLLPPHGVMRVAHDGSLWVLDSEQPEAEAVYWTMFEPDGLIRARIKVPPALIIDAGADYVVLIGADSLGLQTVSVHRF